MMSYLWILLLSGALLAGRANTQDDVAPTEDATVHSTLLPEIVENLDLHAEAGIEKIVPVSEPEPTDAGAHEHVTPPEGEVQPDAASETEPEPDQSQPETTADEEPEATIEGEAETAPKEEDESIAEPEPEAAAEPEPEDAAGPEAAAGPAPEPEVAPEPEDAAEPEAAVEPEPEAAAGPAAEPEAAAEPETDAEPEAAAEPETDAEPEAAAEPEPDAAAGPAAEPTAAAEPAAAPEPEAEDAAEPEAEAPADPEPEAPAEPEPDATAEGEAESEAAESEAASSTQGPAQHPESAQDIPDVDEEPSTSTADVSHAHEEHGSEDEGTAGADAAVPHDQSAHEGVEMDVGTEIKAQVPSDGGFNLEDALSRGNAQDTPAHSGRSKNAGSVAHAAEATGGEIDAEESGSSSLAAILCAVGVAFVGAGTAYYTYQKKKLCFKNLHEEDPEAARKADAGEAQSDPQVLSNLLNSS